MASMRLIGIGKSLSRDCKPKYRYPQNNLQSIVMCWGRSNQENTIVAANFVHSLSVKLEKLTIKIHVSQSDGQRALMFTIFCTQVLDLGVSILASVVVHISCNSIMLQVTNC